MLKVQINNLKKMFDGKVAVDIPNLTIQGGEILGLVGNNGAGKTTLFRLMLDLLRADKGEVLMAPDGEESRMAPATDAAHTTVTDGSAQWIDPAKTETWKAYTGAYIDSGFLIDFLTPEEYFDFIAKVNHVGKEQLQQQLHELEKLMSGEVLGQKKLIRDLSAGNQQKVGIIAALIAQPKLLILDEPFNFLDPSSQNQLKKTLTDYHRETGATILVSSHNLQHTIEISTRVVLLEKGIVIKDLPNDSGQAEKELENYFNGGEES